MESLIGLLGSISATAAGVVLSLYLATFAAIKKLVIRQSNEELLLRHELENFCENAQNVIRKLDIDPKEKLFLTVESIEAKYTLFITQFNQLLVCINQKKKLNLPQIDEKGSFASWNKVKKSFDALPENKLDQDDTITLKSFFESYLEREYQEKLLKAYRDIPMLNNLSQGLILLSNSLGKLLVFFSIIIFWLVIVSILILHKKIYLGYIILLVVFPVAFFTFPVLVADSERFPHIIMLKNWFINKKTKLSHNLILFLPAVITALLLAAYFIFFVSPNSNNLFPPVSLPNDTVLLREAITSSEKTEKELSRVLVEHSKRLSDLSISLNSVSNETEKLQKKLSSIETIIKKKFSDDDTQKQSTNEAEASQEAGLEQGH